MPYCLSLLRAMTVIGTGIFNLFFSSICPKTARICSIRKATSRPRLSPASVSTEKCAVCTSIHLGSSLANAGGKEQPATSRLKTTAPILNLRFTLDSLPENASTPSSPRPFILAPGPRARYTLVRGHSSFFPPRLDRLDARPSLRPHVPDPLLRLLAGRRCPPHQLSQRIATPGHAARATLSFSRRNFLRLGYRQTHAQRPDHRRNHPHHGSPRRRNPRL